MKLIRWDFELISAIEVERLADGSIREFRPQDGFANPDRIALNKHGSGPFCRFTIEQSAPKGAGVYAFVVDGQLAYVGECTDLKSRVNAGYGNIQPRNCYRGGQSTNCRVNSSVFTAASASHSVELYFCATNQRLEVEAALIELLRPPWNLQRGRPTRKEKSMTTSSVRAHSSSCAQDVLTAAQAIVARKGENQFSVQEVIEYLQRAGTSYATSTIRTHVTSVCCTNAPANHGSRHHFFERVGRNSYRVIRQ